VIWLLVGAGGAIGAMARHGLNSLVHRRLLATVFPHGIFIVNIIGSALIGIIAGIIVSGRLHVSTELRTFLVVGILGGFTTFSSFSLDTLTLLRSGHIGLGIWNVVGQVGLSLLATAIGLRIGLSS